MSNLAYKYENFTIHDNSENKKCKCCNKVLPMSEFKINKKDYTYKTIYHDSMCKSCKSKYIRLRRQIRYDSMDSVTLKAEKAYESMIRRCTGKNRADCYKDVTICEEWLHNKQAFIDWYIEHYYEVENQKMAIDKDLFGGDLKYYSPDTTCILPQIINTMLSNSKRHRLPDKKSGKTLPLCVYYNKTLNKYYAIIKCCDAEKAVKLSYHDTPEEAFEEYRKCKKQDIKKMADKYKEYLPDYVYEALLRFEIKPY